MTTISLSEFYHRFPKADLHYHLLGGVRLETMLDLAAKYDIDLPLDEAKAFYRAHQIPGSKRKGGIEALTFLYRIMRETADYQRVLMEVVEDAAACGVRYLELFWNPSDTELAYEAVNNALAITADDALECHGVLCRFIPSINREKSPEEAVEMVQTLLAHPHPYVLGIGIDYKEQQAPVENFWKAYKLAKDSGLRLTAHCSEFGLHWRNVETGIELIGCERIDHGYTIIDNPSMAEKYARAGVPFTVVPSNTYYFSQWPEHSEWCNNHPIRKMAKAGLNIIPCTDDWHIHNTTSANCYRVMVEDFGFDLDGIRQMVKNSIEASWVSSQQKAEWHENWLAEFDALRAQLEQEPEIPSEKHIRYLMKK